MKVGGDSRRFLDAKAQRNAKDAKEFKPAFLCVFAFLCAFASKNRNELGILSRSAP